MLKAGGAETGGDLSFFVADLSQDAGWAELVGGCDYVLHVALPFLESEPRDIKSPRDGVLRVLRMSRDAGVTRVVLTSSFATISYGEHPRNTLFTERIWNDLSK